jgi:hypothetical protein
MDEVIASFRQSIPKTLGWVVAGAILTAASAFYVIGIPDSPPPALAVKIAGWVGLPGFGFATLLMLVRLFQSGPVIEVTATGISYRRWPQAFVVPWTAVAGVSERRARNTRFLVLELRPDPEHDIARAQTQAIMTTGVEGTIDDVLGAIRTARTLSAAGGRGSNPIRQQG